MRRVFKEEVVTRRKRLAGLPKKIASTGLAVSLDYAQTSHRYRVPKRQPLVLLKAIEVDIKISNVGHSKYLGNIQWERQSTLRTGERRNAVYIEHDHSWPVHEDPHITFDRWFLTLL